jgi:hypothetical protein
VHYFVAAHSILIVFAAYDVQGCPRERLGAILAGTEFWEAAFQDKCVPVPTWTISFKQDLTA